MTASAVLITSLSLAGCSTWHGMNNGVNSGMDKVSKWGNATVGTGVKYTAKTVSTGAHVIANTGAAIGHGVGKVADGVSAPLR